MCFQGFPPKLPHKLPSIVGGYRYRREELKKAFVGKLANMASTTSGYADENGKKFFYPKLAFSRSSMPPDTHRTIALDDDHEWCYEAFHGYGFVEGTVVLIVDVVRCVFNTAIPSWGAIVVLNEKTWMINLDDLVLGTET